MDEGRNLATAGIWNFFWRLGTRPVSCTLDHLPPEPGAVLVGALEREPTLQQAANLRAWIAAGGYLVASGHARCWADTLQWERDAWSSQQPENPYAGLAWALAGRVELVAPTRWPFSRCRATPAGARLIGNMVAVQGERQTPSRATLALLDAPAIVAGAGYCYLNGHPFAALQAWLQGQADLQPWSAWRHRLFWLDEWVSAIAGVLIEVGDLPADVHGPGIAGLGATTVVLRHDLDHSRDRAYLDLETSRSLPATHGVLRDNNTAYWRAALAPHGDHETALHYNTGGRDWLRDGLARIRRRAPAPYRARASEVAGRGLLRQVEWAKAQGIGVSSLLRHLSFQVYPEWIDGLDLVFGAEASVLGGSSMFRAQVLRWGTDRIDGSTSTMGEWPDPQFPYWLPFKLAHAADGGRRTRGWETTSVMEAEPELVDQFLAHRIAHLPQRVVTLGFHPAHATGPTFHRSGSLASFALVLDVVAARGADVRCLRDVFRLADATGGGVAS